jgi:hypothetical protein
MKRTVEDHGPSLFDYAQQRQERVKAQSKAEHTERHVLGRGGYRGGRTNIPKSRIRLAEFKKLIKHRHGGGACDTDDGEIYLRHAIPCLLSLATGHNAQPFYEQAMGFCQTFLPILAMGDGPAMIERARQNPASREWRHLKADPLAKALRVTSEERSILDLRTIGSMDKSKGERAQDPKKKDAEYQAERRAQAGATPRSASKVAQAKALGMSLSTYKRRLKEGLIETDAKAPDPISSAIVRSTHSHSTYSVHPNVQAVEGPARQASPSRSVGAGGHSPRGRTRTLRQGNAVAQSLPNDGVSQPDMLAEFQMLGDVVNTYIGGIVPPELVLIIKAAQRERNQTQETVARHVGVSRPQFTNAMQGRFGLSQSAAANLVRWLEAA